MLLLTETRVERQQNNEGQSDVWRGGGDCPEGHMSGHCGDGACTHDQTGIRTKINRRRRRRRRRLAGRDSTQVRAMTTPSFPWVVLVRVGSRFFSFGGLC